MLLFFAHSQSIKHNCMEIQDLLDRIDIVEVASMFTELTEKDGEFWGISPITFPPEKTPSFSVRRESGRFYDFSSGVGGTAITLVEYCKKISKHEAIEFLKQHIGAEGEAFSSYKKLPATLVCKRFMKPRQAQKQSKGVVLPDDYMLRYEKRNDKLDVWRQEGISDASLERFQVYYDAYSNCLVYPVRNVKGEIVNVGARTLDEDWKEKGMRKYSYRFGWGTLDTLYGLAENMASIREKGEVILFEGCKSVLIADSWGIKNTACLLTSHLNPNQMRILAKLGYRVVFALDKEVRIRDDHNIQKLKRYVNVEYLCDMTDLLDAKDAPVDKGREVFQKLYDARFKFR